MILGSRFSYYSKLKYLHISPYFKFNYRLSDNSKITASLGKYYSNLYSKREIFSNSYYYPFSLLFFSDSENNIPTSTHYSLGYNHKNILPDFTFEVEGYFKTRNNIFTSNELTEKISFNDGYSTGIDILLKKDQGALNGWISYSLCRTVKKNVFNENYFANYNRTHNLKIFLNYNLSNRWRLDAVWFIASGLPYTPVIGKYIDQNFNDYKSTQNIFGKKNSMNLEMYHRLDVGFTGSFIWWGSVVVKPYIQIMNVYNSDNAFNLPEPPQTAAYDDVANTDVPSKRSFIFPSIGITLEF